MAIHHTTLGSGKEHVIILHDWACDSSSYDPILNYLDKDSFTYVFPDIRGYGASKDMKGDYTSKEIANDVLELADSLGWDKFHLVGHSMTGMAGLRLLADAKDRVKSFVAITPVPASGLPVPDETFEFLKDAASANDEAARQGMHLLSGNRLTDTFARYKVSKWRKTSIPEARVGYLKMFARTNFADETKGIDTPMLVLAGKHDMDGLNEATVRETFLKWYPKAKLEVIENSAHYPMQETPVYLVTAMEKFMKEQAGV